jgi:hypothetical protein
LRSAGYAFSIWGLIYVGLAAFAIYQITPGARNRPTSNILAWPGALAVTGCGAWILASTFKRQWTSIGIIVLSAAVLVAGLLHSDSARARASRAERLLIVGPLSLLAGWLTIAAALNVLTVLTAKGLIASTGPWGAAGIVTVGLVGGVVGWRLRSPVYVAPIIWGLCGVFIAERQDHPADSTLALLAAALLTLGAFWRSYAGRSGDGLRPR